MYKLLYRVAAVIELVSGLLLGVVTLIIFAAAFARYGLNVAIPDAFDAARLLLAVCLMWGLAAATYKNTHIRVDILWMALPPRWQRAVDILAEALVLLFLVLTAWMFFTTLSNVMASAEQTFDLRLPIWPAYAAGWLGLIGAALMGILRLLHLVTDWEDTLSDGELFHD